MIVHFPVNETLRHRQLSLRSAVGELAIGVTVVTAGRSPQRISIVPASVAAISAAPLEVVLCLNAPWRSYPRFAQCDRFAVNVLSDQHRFLAQEFGDGFGEFIEAHVMRDCWHDSTSGLPLLGNAAAVIECSITDVVERRLSAIVFGRALSGQSNLTCQPIIRWRGSLDWHASAHSPDLDDWSPLL
jgi:flavin reductase (DIM6/NTAB) family NADH-FMN oxidoreductase RutF